MNLLHHFTIYYFLGISAGVNYDTDTPIQDEEQAAEEAASNNLRVSRYLGLGYNIFRGNPLSINLDPGLKRNSFKPVKILRSFSKPNASCPDLTHCLNSHEPEVLETTIYARNIQDYQKGILDLVHVYGRVTVRQQFITIATQWITKYWFGQGQILYTTIHTWILTYFGHSELIDTPLRERKRKIYSLTWVSVILRCSL